MVIFVINRQCWSLSLLSRPHICHKYHKLCCAIFVFKLFCCFSFFGRGQKFCLLEKILQIWGMSRALWYLYLLLPLTSDKQTKSELSKLFLSIWPGSNFPCKHLKSHSVAASVALFSSQLILLFFLFKDTFQK